MPDQTTDITTVLRGAADSLEQMADAATPGDWRAHFTIHGDPMIVHRDATRGSWPTHRIADVSTSPDDYGRANALLLGALGGPVLARALAVHMRATVERHRGQFSFDGSCDWCGHLWPCPDLLAWSPVAEHITQTQGENS